MDCLELLERINFQTSFIYTRNHDVIYIKTKKNNLLYDLSVNMLISLGNKLNNNYFSFISLDNF